MGRGPATDDGQGGAPGRGLPGGCPGPGRLRRNSAERGGRARPPGGRAARARLHGGHAGERLLVRRAGRKTGGRAGAPTPLPVGQLPRPSERVGAGTRHKRRAGWRPGRPLAQAGPGRLRRAVLCRARRGGHAAAHPVAVQPAGWTRARAPFARVRRAGCQVDVRAARRGRAGGRQPLGGRAEPGRHRIAGPRALSITRAARTVSCRESKGFDGLLPPGPAPSLDPTPRPEPRRRTRRPQSRGREQGRPGAGGGAGGGAARQERGGPDRVGRVASAGRALPVTVTRAARASPALRAPAGRALQVTGPGRAVPPHSAPPRPAPAAARAAARRGRGRGWPGPGRVGRAARCRAARRGGGGSTSRRAGRRRVGAGWAARARTPTRGSGHACRWAVRWCVLSSSRQNQQAAGRSAGRATRARPPQGCARARARAVRAGGREGRGAGGLRAGWRAGRPPEPR